MKLRADLKNLLSELKALKKLDGYTISLNSMQIDNLISFLREQIEEELFLCNEDGHEA